MTRAYCAAPRRGFLARRHRDRLCDQSAPTAGTRSWAPQRIRGFTLTELLIATTIGLIVLSAVAQVFATSRATYRATEGLSRLQENARFSMHFLTWDVRMAGYMGCLQKSTVVTNHLNNPADYATNFVLGQFVNGHSYTGSGGSSLSDWTPPLPAAYFSAGEVVPGTDVLVIRRGSDTGLRVLPPYMPTPSSALQIPTNSGLSVNDIVLVSDCKSADLFQITGPDDPNNTGTVNHNTGTVSQGPGNATQALSKTYQGDAEIMKLMTNVYYIGRRNSDPKNPPALFRKELDKSAVVTLELVDDVDSMQVYYGEDTDGDAKANAYGKSDEVTNWAKVETVRLGLLVRTPGNIDTQLDTHVYPVVGALIGPYNDHRERRVFTSTIELRN
jgi:type IV pilus assembly protein PilW